MLCGLVLILAIVMAVFLFSAPLIVGWSAVLIVMASIGITSLMSGTAATDFGGRKATATCAGVVDGFAYIGSSAPVIQPRLHHHARIGLALVADFYHSVCRRRAALGAKNLA